jgi:type II secretory pathway component PulK
MTRPHGFTLVMAISVLALVSGMGAVLTAPALREAKVARRHQARLQAEYLALAGVEYARSVAGAVTEKREQSYELGGGEVSVSIQPVAEKQYHVTSVGSIRSGSGAGLVTWKLERRITAK